MTVHPGPDREARWQARVLLAAAERRCRVARAARDAADDAMIDLADGGASDAEIDVADAHVAKLDCRLRAAEHLARAHARRVTAASDGGC